MSFRKRPSGSELAPAIRRRKGLTGRSYTVPTPSTSYVPRALSYGEWKYVDVAVTPLVYSTASITLLNGLVPGTGASQRVGMKVALRTIELRGFVESYTGTGLEQEDRIMLLLDKQPNGVGPTAITDFLTAATVVSPRNLANRKRFKLLWDQTFALGAVATTTGTVTTRCFKKYLRFGVPLIVDFNTGTAGTIADIVSNSLHFITFGTEGVGTQGATSSFFIRVRYTDM